MTSPENVTLSPAVTTWAANIAAALALFSAQPEGVREHWLTLAYGADLPAFRRDTLVRLAAASGNPCQSGQHARSLDHCPGCGRRITDHDDDGCELDSSQRWCVSCLAATVAAAAELGDPVIAYVQASQPSTVRVAYSGGPSGAELLFDDGTTAAVTQ